MSDQIVKLKKIKNKNNLFFQNVKGKKVDYVVKYILREKPISNEFLHLMEIDDLFSENNNEFSYVIWQGTTNDNYFRVVFYVGTVVIICSEREMLLGVEKSYNIGYINNFSKQTDDFNRENDTIYDYIKSGTYNNHVKNINFEDIMKLLNWKYKNKSVVEEINDYSY